MFGLFAILITACTKDNRPLRKEVIKSPQAPAAIGPYSQAIKVGNTLYCSGQIAINPETGQLVTGDIAAETKQVLENLGAVLREAGMDYSDVVQATVYMTEMENYGLINDIYAQYFKEMPPARAAVQVARLPKNVHVEIACIAVKAVMNSNVGVE
ncbi:MAG: RidA family protein [candidate division KSB1 bacterium]|nr:RidA family protein [candidate division KSB1 bacterium]MDZ7318726.1 RidA family protein [candidate division KSB1 bacterium]MDZ7341096.1 RidA family protein [candidate division KSB1 bacterium]